MLWRAEKKEVVVEAVVEIAEVVETLFIEAILCFSTTS